LSGSVFRSQSGNDWRGQRLRFSNELKPSHIAQIPVIAEVLRIHIPIVREFQKINVVGRTTYPPTSGSPDKPGLQRG
jgi:hypothetical protein